jgi:hypothetical protein
MQLRISACGHLYFRGRNPKVQGGSIAFEGSESMNLILRNLRTLKNEPKLLLRKINPRGDTCQSERQLLARARLFGRQQYGHVHPESLGNDYQLGVSHATQLRFDLRESRPAQFQPQNRASGGEHFLCQSLLITQFPDLRADNVFIFHHAPKSELDSIGRRAFDCSDFGATCLRDGRIESFRDQIQRLNCEFKKSKGTASAEGHGVLESASSACCPLGIPSRIGRDQKSHIEKVGGASPERGAIAEMKSCSPSLRSQNVTNFLWTIWPSKQISHASQNHFSREGRRHKGFFTILERFAGLGRI